MKKYISFIVVCFIACMCTVNAIVPDNYVGDLNVTSFDLTTDTVFDYSAVEFPTTVSGKTIKGKSGLKKIYGEYTLSNATRYFTAYCLDGNKKYPDQENNLNNYIIGEDADKTTKTNMFNEMAVLKIMKMCQANNSCHLFDSIPNVSAFIFKDGNSGPSTIVEPDDDTLTAFTAGEDVQATVTSFIIAVKEIDNNKSLATFTAAQIAAVLPYPTDADGNITVSFNTGEFDINNYTVSTLPSTEGYNKALWIIEHSYPNLPLETALQMAGVNYSALRTAIAAKLALVDNTANINKITEAVQNYVYATTQYAIWRVVGEYFETYTDDNGVTSKAYLGNSLNTSNNVTFDSSELNVLYQYLIKDRPEFVNYNTRVVNNTLELGLPSGTEGYSTTSEAFIYGPYTIKSNMLYTGPVTLTIEGTPAGVTVVDNAGNGITGTVNVGEKVYLKVLKTANVSSIKVNLNAAKGYIFATTNAGRLFTPDISVYYQNVATGAQTIESQGSGSTSLVINPKTGVEDIGTILLISLIAFTCGYLVLRFKPEPAGEL